MKRKLIQQELRSSLRQAKLEYKRKVERKLRNNDTREVWRGMKTITGYGRKPRLAAAPDMDKANELNLFFNRFDSSAGASPAHISMPFPCPCPLPPVLSPIRAPPPPLLELAHSGPPLWKR